MAKALVFEGCPACERSEFGQIAARDIGPYLMGTLQGGAIGAGGVILADIFLPKILPTLSPIVRALITGAAVMGGAYLLKEKYPDMATGLAIGGGGIVIYKVVGSLLGKIIAAPEAVAPTAGLYGLGEEIEIEESPYGVLVPEELGQEELIIE